METEKLHITKGELAWHDWQRTLRVRKGMDNRVLSGAMALVRDTDAWHPSAFIGTGVEHLLPAAQGPAESVFSLIDWCGNVVGQIDDCPYGPVGKIYDVQGLGVGLAFYQLARFGAEMSIDGVWFWWLEFAYTDECKVLALAAHKASFTER